MAAAAVGNGAMHLFTPRKGIIAHREAGDFLQTYVGLNRPAAWFAAIDFTDAAAATSPITAYEAVLFPWARQPSRTRAGPWTSALASAHPSASSTSSPVRSAESMRETRGPDPHRRRPRSDARRRSGVWGNDRCADRAQPDASDKQVGTGRNLVRR